MLAPSVRLAQPSEPDSSQLNGSRISFAVGESVQYFSSSQQRWYDTEVVAANDFAGVQVKLKPGTWIKPQEYAAKLKKEGALAAAGKHLLTQSMKARDMTRRPDASGAEPAHRAVEARAARVTV